MVSIHYLMQFQADLINSEIIQNIESEITGLGTAFIAGLKTKFWSNLDEISKLTKIKRFSLQKQVEKKLINYIIIGLKQLIQLGILNSIYI